MDIYRLGIICMAAILHYRILKRHIKFLPGSRAGNGFAMHDLGRMFADGLGRDADVGLAQKWYEKALEAFLVREESVKKKEKPYLQYRIGKMYASGLGAEQNYEKAAHWFLRRLQWTISMPSILLAGLYRRGRGWSKMICGHSSLYRSSAEQGNPYASLELAKMYRDGLGTEPDPKPAERISGCVFRFRDIGRKKVMMINCSTELVRCSTQEREPKRMIREQLNIGKKSAKLGNTNAQYALGKLWLETGSGDSGQAVE